MERSSKVFTTKLMIYWFIFMGMCPLFYKPILNLNYENGFVLTAIHFLLFSGLGIHLFHPQKLIEFVKSWKVPYIIGITGICYAFFMGIEHFYPISKTRVEKIYEIDLLFPLFNYKVFISKQFDIIFQQVLINVLMFYYIEKYGKKRSTIYFGLFFAFIHIPLLFIFGPLKGMIFLLPSTLGGLSFAYLISNFKHGKEYAFALHWCFYLVIGMFLRYMPL